jgi:hypothetical protein
LLQNRSLESQRERMVDRPAVHREGCAQDDTKSTFKWDIATGNNLVLQLRVKD